jgi:hypothetical protein
MVGFLYPVLGLDLIFVENIALFEVGFREDYL